MGVHDLDHTVFNAYRLNPYTVERERERCNIIIMFMFKYKYDFVTSFKGEVGGWNIQ